MQPSYRMSDDGSIHFYMKMETELIRYCQFSKSSFALIHPLRTSNPGVIAQHSVFERFRGHKYSCGEFAFGNRTIVRFVSFSPLYRISWHFLGSSWSRSRCFICLLFFTVSALAVFCSFSSSKLQKTGLSASVGGADRSSALFCLFFSLTCV